MRSLFLLLFTLITFPFYAQKVEERNYHFDNYKVITIKNHFNKNDFKVIRFHNSKDSTYTLQLVYNVRNQDFKYVRIEDSKNKESIIFDFYFNFKDISDLSKLIKPVLTKYNDNYIDKVTQFNPSIEKIEYEVDTTKNSTIVHLTRFDDNSFKKIINEEYYFFEKDDKINCTDSYSVKKYLQDAHNLTIDKEQHLKKKYRLYNGKIGRQEEYQEIINIDYNFNVKNISK